MLLVKVFHHGFPQSIHENASGVPFSVHVIAYYPFPLYKYVYTHYNNDLFILWSLLKQIVWLKGKNNNNYYFKTNYVQDGVK